MGSCGAGTSSTEPAQGGGGGGGGNRADIGRRVVSLNSNKKYAVDTSRTTRVNKHTHKRMRPVIRLNSSGGIKYRTYINLTGAVPETKAAMVRAERAARKRRRRRGSTRKPKAKAKSRKKSKSESGRSIASLLLPKAKATTRKATTRKAAARKAKATTRKATNAQKAEAAAPSELRNLFRIDKSNPAVRRLKKTLDRMEDIRRRSMRRGRARS